MPATARIRMVSKNRGLVKNGCCVVSPPPSCIPPTAGAVTNSSQVQGTAILTVAYTGATSFQWWYSYNPLEDPFPPRQFVDRPGVSGSTTPTLTVTTDMEGSILRPVYCIVTNACGSATSASVLLYILIPQ